MIVDLSKAPAVSASAPVAYEETLKTAGFRGGLYVLRAGATDPQRPHAEDEAYYVVRGRATFEMEGARTAVGPGHAILVPAGMPHRFVDVEEDITLFVVFAVRPAAPSASGPSAGSSRR
jgi:mannose-6-phosphate isomerase-like protein (cupin superfamily)